MAVDAVGCADLCRFCQALCQVETNSRAEGYAKWALLLAGMVKKRGEADGGTTLRRCALKAIDQPMFVFMDAGQRRDLADERPLQKRPAEGQCRVEGRVVGPRGSKVDLDALTIEQVEVGGRHGDARG